MQIRVAGIAVTNKSLMMTSAGTERTREAAMTIVLPFDVAPIEKLVLLFLIDAGAYIAQSMRVGIDEAMAGCDVTGRTDADQA